MQQVVKRTFIGPCGTGANSEKSHHSRRFLTVLAPPPTLVIYCIVKVRLENESLLTPSNHTDSLLGLIFIYFLFYFFTKGLTVMLSCKFGHFVRLGFFGARCSSVARSWSNESSDRSLRVDLLSYFSFQPVLHDWYNEGHDMCDPVCGMVHIKESLLLTGKSSPCGGSGFPVSYLSFTICQTPFNCNKVC